MEQADYPAMSGSNTICTATVLINERLVPVTEPITQLTLEAPAGLVRVRAEVRDGTARAITFENVPAFAVHLDRPVEVPQVGTVTVDVAWGGMFYALVEAEGGALWIALRAQRRTQLRHRRPGTVIPPPPAELIPAEKTAHATASVIAPRIDALDAALRSLPSVRLLTVALSTDEVRLALRESAELPSPWSGSATEWRLNLSVVPNRPDDSFPPYPLLVSVGQGDDGSFLFLNLEELRTVTLTGDSDRNASFARHVAAELAVNPWSMVTTVDVLGLGSDLASFNLGRVRTHPPRDTGFIAELTHNLSPITATITLYIPIKIGNGRRVSKQPILNGFATPCSWYSFICCF